MCVCVLIQDEQSLRGSLTTAVEVLLSRELVSLRAMADSLQISSFSLSSSFEEPGLYSTVGKI